MRQSTPEPTLTHDGDTMVVEAATAEAALATVHDHLGSDAEILAAEKVLAGGLWGFFPKEQVQIRARPSQGSEPEEIRPARSARPGARRVEPPAPTDDVPGPPTADGEAAGLAGVLSALAAEEDDREEGLGAALRRHLGVTIDGDHETEVSPEAAPEPARAPATATGTAGRWRPPAVDPATPRVTGITAAPESEEAAPEPPAARREQAPQPEAPAVAQPESFSLDDVEWSEGSGLAWSGRALLRLGLPRALVDAVLTQQPTDDASWLFALAQAVTPLCRPLPAGESVLVGPRAQTLAKGLHVPLVRLSSTPKGIATFAVAARHSRNARGWIGTHRGSRWLHVVAGGTDWRGWIFADPLAVSWIGHETIGEAVRTAHDLGLVLGYGLADDGDPVRATPVDVAVAVRAALEELR